MAFAAGLLHQLPARSHKERQPLRHVACMVKYPCSCCWISLAVAIVLSFIGFRLVSANSGPLGPFKIGVDYPNFDIIARQADAHVLAREQSALALLGAVPAESGRRGGFGRRLGLADTLEDPMDTPHQAHVPTSAELLIDFTEQLLREGGEEETSNGLLQSITTYRRSLQTTAAAATQDQQSVSMATALLAVSARKGVANLYDDAGLSQLCTFRKGLMEDEPTWKDYCLLQDDPKATGSGEAAKVCNKGTDVLSMFYGDADYDIDTIDTAVFATANFDDIVTAYSRFPPDMAKLAAYPAADRVAVGALYLKLLGYLTGAWQDSTYVCDAKYKKDVPKALKVLAHIREAESLSTIGGILNQYFDKNFNVSNPVTKYTKGFYSYGAPLKDFSNYIEAADKEKQDAQYSRWWTTSKFRSLYPEGESTLWPTGQPSLLNTQLLLSEILLVLIGDGLKAIAPVILVTLIVWLQTGSLLIAIVTIVEILLSISTALFVTAGLFQIKWVSFQAFLALYIVLAIGADDVFVFMDAYKQSFYRGKDVNQSLVHRMSWVYRRAGLAMLITSLTTCSAFIASALSSPIPELQNFGIFAASIIMIDYLLVMTFLCANSIIFHNWLEMKPGLCCACCDDCLVKKDSWKWSKGGCTALCEFSEAKCKGMRTTEIAAASSSIEESAKPLAVRIFEDEFPFNLVVKKVPTRIVSILFCVICLALCISSATKIQPQTSTENFLPDNHPFQRNIAINNEFEASNFDSTVEINMVWGFKEDDPIDQTGVNLIFDADYKGKPQYKADFEMTVAAQNALVTVCDQLKATKATKTEVDITTGNSTVLTTCFIETFRDYRAYKGLSFPVVGAADAAKALETWLEDKDTTVPRALRAQKHETDVGWTKTDGVLKLQWVKLRTRSLLGSRAFLPASQLREFYNTWEGVLAEANKLTVPTSLGKGFQMAGANAGRGNRWIFMTVQEAYVRMALVGAGVGLVIATFVLLLATRNIIVTLLCMGTIAAALGCVIGTIVAMGWQLGSNESLCIMVLCGFAVDYVVHLSHAYMESESLTRLERVHDALRDLGISVFWGMLTSMFAAAALASCQIQFLSKFGIFFMLTISYAYLWSVLFLMPCLAFIGPEPVGSAHGVKDPELVSPTPPFKESSFEMAASAPPSPPGSDAGDDQAGRVVGRVAAKRTQTAPYVV